MIIIKTDRGKSLKVYQFIIDYIKENGYAPSVREIGDGCYLSVSSAFAYLTRLEIDGLIETKPHASRAIKVIGYEFVRVEE